MTAFPRPYVRQWALLLAAACLLAAAAGAREAQQQEQLHGEEAAAENIALLFPDPAPNQNSLQTYYFHAVKPEVQLLPAEIQTLRRGRTTLRVKLTGPASVSAFMPIMAPDASGMTHQVVKTWEALKNYALMFSRVHAINEQAAAAGSSSRVFPVPGIAVTAASDASAPMDVGRLIDAAEAQGQRPAWTEPSPSSVLLMPAGQSVAAVADIMNAAYDEAAGAITLDLDLVHDPHIVSEFQPHDKQTLDAATSHFHFATPAGVRVDAAGLLKALAASKYELPGLHVFAKGLRSPCTVTVTSQAASGGVQVDFTKSGSCGGWIVTPGSDGESGAASTCDALTYTITPDANYQLIRATSCSSRGGGDGDGAGVLQTPQTVGLLNGLGSILLKLRGSVLIKPTSLTLQGGSTVPFARVPANGLALTGVGAARLAVTPAKAYRHVHDSITLTALALDASGAAAAGVTVTFAVVGDCEPVLASARAVTDAGGRATAVISAKKPGAVAVVAAATSATGGTLVAPASHIIFFHDRHYVEHKERHYYGGGYGDSYGQAQAYAEVTPDADSDAERFAAEATKKAVAQLEA